MRRPIGDNGYEGVSEVLSIGVRVGTEMECYKMLGMLRAYYGSRIDQSRSRDTIAEPADNGYRTLKEVVDLGFGLVEVVIMTEEMEEFNNWGVVSLIRRGIEDLSNYRMRFIFTPDGEVRVMPLTASLWDVAAAINQELVTMMAAVKVDGEYELPSSQVRHATTVEIVAGKTGTFVTDRSWMAASLPETRRILNRALEEAAYRRTVEVGEGLAQAMLSKRGVLFFGDIRNEIRPLLSQLGCRNVDELLFAIGDGEVDAERLDAVLDKRGVNKRTLGLSTLLVKGVDEPGVLYRLTGLVGQLGGNIVRSVNAGGEEYTLRLVIRGLDHSSEALLKRDVLGSGVFREVTVV